MGSHQAHDASGKALEWNASTRTFEGTPAFTIDSKGNLIYQEATITIYEATIAEEAALEGRNKQSVMVEVNAHEDEHNLNTEDIQSIKDRGEGKPNPRNVETAAGRVGRQVREEIDEKKKKKGQ